MLDWIYERGVREMCMRKYDIQNVRVIDRRQSIEEEISKHLLRVG